jgi:uncharacterized protein YjbI with pentapeptide repeats
VLVIVVPVLFMTTAAVLVLSRLLDTSSSTGRLELVRTALAVGAGTGALTTLVLARRRLWATEHDASERRLTELYVKAIEQLGADKAAVRHGALYALERVAQDNVDHRQTVVDVLCAYLRTPFTPPPDKPGGRRLGSLPRSLRGTPATRAAASARRATSHLPLHTPSEEDRRQEREVRATAQRILQRHLNPGRKPRRPVRTFWRTIDLDLTEATLVNFDLSNCHIRAGRFTHTTFTGLAQFEGTRFEHDADFGKARFEGDAQFDGARFERLAWFHEARFERRASFNSARFTHYTQFGKARFEDAAWFGKGRFEDLAGFVEAQFAKSASFEQTRFLGNADFEEARFEGDATFGRARFEGLAGFVAAQFAKSASFKVTRFRGTAWFGQTRFAGDATFDDARCGREAWFDEALFGGETQFRGTVFSSAPSVSEAHLRVNMATNRPNWSILPDGWTTGLDLITLPAEEGTWAPIVPALKALPPAQVQSS